MEDIMRAAMATGLTEGQRDALREELERDALEREPQPSTWPPALANRATRRACKHRTKAGYCVDCGTPIRGRQENER